MSAPLDRTPPSPPGIGDHVKQLESYKQDHPLRPGQRVSEGSLSQQSAITKVDYKGSNKMRSQFLGVHL